MGLQRSDLVLVGGTSSKWGKNGIEEGIEEVTEEGRKRVSKWLSCDEFAKLAGTTSRRARQVLSKGFWKDQPLLVEMVPVERGGVAGKAPRVYVKTLPYELRAAWYLQHGVDLDKTPEAPVGQDIGGPQSWDQDDRYEHRLATARYRYEVIKSILPVWERKHRGPLVKQAATVTRTLPTGRVCKLTEATIYNWLRAFEAEGLGGLIPKERKDKGNKRFDVSLIWDQFFADHLRPDQIETMGVDLTHYIRSLWASGERGKYAVSEKATTKLIEMTRKLGVVAFDRLDLGRPCKNSGTGTQFEVCFVNTRRAEAEKKYRIIAIKRKDNAKFQDEYMPHIMRDYTGYKPRDIVVGDVHPMDVMMRRDDGSPVYPKAIAWMDVATNEVHMTFVLLEKGEGIRREHVAQAFEAMVAEWGLPKLLYLDNGSEYSWDAMIDGFTQLSKLTEGAFSMANLEASEVRDRVVNTRQAVIRSMAYNAKGKPGIEGVFGNLEQVHFALMPGWTSGDRMSKKTHAKGKDPVAFPGTAQDFLTAASTQLEWYHKRPQRGRLNGVSPNEALADFINEGWGKTVVSNRHILKLAFSEKVVRMPKSGRVSFKNRFNDTRFFYSDDLLNQHTPVTLRIPAYDPDVVFCFDGDRFLCTAQPERTFGVLDRAGAEELGRRKKHYVREVKELAQHCALLDLVEETRRHNQHVADTPEAPIAARVDSDVLNRMVEAERIARQDQADAAANRPRRGVVEQWKTPVPKVLQDFEFADEDDD